MNCKWLWFLAIALIVGFSTLADARIPIRPRPPPRRPPNKVPEQCQVQPKARVNCGYPYISAQECYNRGCCFDSSVVGVIWCFFPRHNPECSI